MGFPPKQQHTCLLCELLIYQGSSTTPTQSISGVAKNDHSGVYLAMKSRHDQGILLPSSATSVTPAGICNPMLLPICFAAKRWLVSTFYVPR